LTGRVDWYASHVAVGVVIVVAIDLYVSFATNTTSLLYSKE
jgi:hypothetical protein